MKAKDLASACRDLPHDTKVMVDVKVLKAFAPYMEKKNG